jgi:hypothetical protein
MKKLIFTAALFLTCAACSSLKPAAGTADVSVSAKTTGQADTPVQLIRSGSYLQEINGTSEKNYNFQVRVENLAYAKNVFVHQKLTNGNWTNIALSYSGPLDSGFELWNVYFNNSMADTQFVIGYTVNGVTYWDNNDGSYYNQPLNSGEMLGVRFNVGVYYWAFMNNTLSVQVDVRNLAYSKTVKIVWSSDSWKTSQVGYASFQSSYTYGYATVSCPTAAGFERWTAAVSTGSIPNLQFYVEYDVNGQQYFDNNWNSNFGD